MTQAVPCMKKTAMAAAAAMAPPATRASRAIQMPVVTMTVVSPATRPSLMTFWVIVAMPMLAAPDTSSRAWHSTRCRR